MGVELGLLCSGKDVHLGGGGGDRGIFFPLFGKKNKPENVI